MSVSGACGISLALMCAASCGGMTTLQSTGPSPAVAAPQVGGVPTRVISGSIGSAVDSSPPCFADRYPCEVYTFALEREGPIEVTLTWDGAPRALLVQLYWTGEGLAHEDVAPRSGPSRISFLRPRMEAARYTVRVVSLEPARAIPFTLALTY